MEKNTSSILSDFMGLFILAVLACVIGLALLLPLSDPQQRAQYGVKAYDRWSEVPSDTLLQKARVLGRSEEKIDTAVTLFTITANRYYEQGMKTADAMSAVKALNGLGCLFSLYYNENQIALGYFSEGLRLAEKYGFREQMVYICHNMGNSFTYSGDINSFQFYSRQAQDYYRQSFHYAVGIQSWEIVLVEYSCLMGSILSEGNFSDAAKDIQYFKQLKWPGSIPGYSYANTLTEGTALMNKGRREAALVKFSLLPAYSHSSGIPHEQLFNECALIGLARLYHQMGDKEQLAACLHTMQKTAHDEMDVNLRLYALRYRYLLCKQSGDMAQANVVRVEYIQLNDSDFSRRRKLFDSQRGYYAQLDNISTLARTQHRGLKAKTVVALVLIALGLGLLCVALWRKRSARFSKSGKYVGSRLSSEKKEQLAIRIEDVLARKEIITDPDFTIRDLADHIDARYQYVSQVVNEVYGKNFKTLLTERRVMLACRMMDDCPAGEVLKIEFLAASVGFKSRSSFTMAFKKMMKVSPSEYQQQTAKRKQLHD